MFGYDNFRKGLRCGYSDWLNQSVRLTKNGVRIVILTEKKGLQKVGLERPSKSNAKRLESEE